MGRARTDTVASSRTRRATSVHQDERLHPSASELLSLQRRVGNAAVTSLLERRGDADAGAGTVTQGGHDIQQPITVALPIRPRGQVPPARPTADTTTVSGATADAPEGHERARVRRRRRQRLPSVPELRPGQSVTIPEPVSPPLQVEETDSVFGSLAPNATIARGGTVPPGNFGITRTSVGVSDVSISRFLNVFLATANVNIPIRWQVRAVTGPSGQRDIASDSDPDITAGNYPTVASDLRPNMSSNNGRPPRTRFWAKDLTERHEQFHADERRSFGIAGAVQANAWLNGQSASTTAEARALVEQVPDRVLASYAVTMANPGKENRAYGDGAPAYRARSDAIRAKGDAGGYAGGGTTPPTPTPPTPTPPTPTPATTGRVRAFPHLRIRSGPSTSTAHVGDYPDGTVITIVGQTTGESIQGNSTWDQTDRGFVADRYVERS